MSKVNKFNVLNGSNENRENKAEDTPRTRSQVQQRSPRSKRSSRDLEFGANVDLSKPSVRRSPRQQALSRITRSFHNSINAQSMDSDSGDGHNGELAPVVSTSTVSNDDLSSEGCESQLDKELLSQSRDTVSAFDIQGAQDVLSLLRVIGEGLLLLSQYQCVEARAVFSQLPCEQYYTGWVLHNMGKAAFEMADYKLAQESFEKMRQVDPSQTAGLEVYSTNLWHLKEEVALCYLAQQAVDMDKMSPESWCVVGNCFSLQKEHDVAIKFFQRALQLDSNFTYAYTLSGHEYVSNEDFEKAVSCYRHAIRTDARHYNAWYGLGTIYYRQEKYELAEYHFRRALAINPRSSVLYCYLGMVLHESRKYELALQMLQQATELEPSNPQARFQRANVLRTMECYEAALEELGCVVDAAPREASVHFLMGKICKQLGRRDSAMIHFSTALDLDPKDSNMIKLSIDKLDSSDIDDDDDL